ncbi:PREDICTED: uncharacterized protein LOC108768980 [Trachymyrmex cornetzi]|uniref:uncharacterized protein LOC108768980 n=1 Tax=Trachymyrmex cornetzi TaxID=471704 RepID=UPI00084EE282|nr:PREDICTED: uncharacterized protein LOC108768980 [Trachymyrmex cornetzi]
MNKEIKCSRFLPPYLYPYMVTTTTITYDEVVTEIDEQTSNEYILGQFQEFIAPIIQEGYVCFYTDGSKFDQDGLTGAGIFSPTLQLEIAHRLPSSVSVFTAEAWAILATLRFILDNNAPKAIILTDSKSVLEAIASSRLDIGNYLIFAIKNQIHLTSEANLHVRFAWIPSHRGIADNETADDLAKSGAKQGDRIDLEIPYTDIFPEVNNSQSMV